MCGYNWLVVFREVVQICWTDDNLWGEKIIFRLKCLNFNEFRDVASMTSIIYELYFQTRSNEMA